METHHLSVSLPLCSQIGVSRFGPSHLRELWPDEQERLFRTWKSETSRNSGGQHKGRARNLQTSLSVRQLAKEVVYRDRGKFSNFRRLSADHGSMAASSLIRCAGKFPAGFDHKSGPSKKKAQGQSDSSSIVGTRYCASPSVSLSSGFRAYRKQSLHRQNCTRLRCINAGGQNSKAESAGEDSNEGLGVSADDTLRNSSHPGSPPEIAGQQPGGSSEGAHRSPSDTASPPPLQESSEHKGKPRSWWAWLSLPGWQWSRLSVLLMQGILFIMGLLCARFLQKSWPGSTWLPPRPVPAAVASVPFSEFLLEVNNNNVGKVQIDGERLTFTKKSAPQSFENAAGVANKGRSASETDDLTLSTIRPGDLATPYSLLISKNVEFSAPDKRSLKLLNGLSVSLLYAGLIVALLGRLPLKFPQRSMGRMRSRKGSGSGRGGASPVLFADVAGVDEAKEELEEIVEYLRDPQRFIQLGARPPRGVLLVGPPGTGKTLLARAVAGEADVPFISCAASEFVELYVGLGAARVRDLFAKAKKDAPSIIFIDEIDAVAKGRDGRLRSMGNDEREQTLNQLLTELDGFDTSATVIVVAATNRADVLDPALRRPGRFDRIVTVEAPDKQGREAILGVHVRKAQMPLATDVDLASVASATAGFTGADLANLVNEAALLTARARLAEVTREQFLQAIERSRGGIEKKRSALGSAEKGVVARHEVGHAVVGTAVAALLPGFPRVEKLSIVPRTGGALGFTYMPPSGEERLLLFADEVRGRLVTLLGGRAAEAVALGGRVSTGALDDIRRATDAAYKAVAEYGLSAAVGPLSLATLAGGGFDDSGGGAAFPWGKDQGHVTELVQREVCELLQRALQVARCVLLANPHVLEGLGALLEAEEKVQGAELEFWLDKVRAPPELAAFVQVEQLVLPAQPPAAILPPPPPPDALPGGGQLQPAPM